ncbi:hypothetical protein GCM10011613_33540 [Cellvibrio zantedeschiae]|uniref:Uncharacterized protein n=1 Tax=Cellvibrio zantedeschiae TaxID=1237077 RepID=A0ABQ3BE02_9GAMM|nr:hypothetical protein [Cellvibrio zantedeschiae]GGY85847.1 hypothetical protein GCM10011613_33540 [Cellvibrio zantedeschiae]
MGFSFGVLLRFIGLSVWHFLSLMIAALVVGQFLSLADPGTKPAEVGPIFLVSLIETAAMFWVVANSKLTGLRLLLASIVIFHGTKTLLMMVELAFFLNIWAAPPLIGLERVLALELHGLLMACLFCPVLVLVLKKWGRANFVSSPVNQNIALKILGVSVFYWLCYWSAGSFILIPLAGDAFNFTYGHLQVPHWLWLFQMGRGLVWAFIIYLLANYLKSSGFRLYFQVGLILAGLSAAQLLSPNPYMMDGLRYAHIVEILVSMLIFGILAAWVLRFEKPVDSLG